MEQFNKVTTNYNLHRPTEALPKDNALCGEKHTKYW